MISRKILDSLYLRLNKLQDKIDELGDNKGYVEGTCDLEIDQRLTKVYQMHKDCMNDLIYLYLKEHGGEEYVLPE